MPPERLVIPTKIRRRLVDEARAAGAQEVCGALIGRRDASSKVDRVTGIRPMHNRADDPRRAFSVDPAELAPILRDCEVLGFYHSHPRGGARPSGSDARAAWTGWWTVIVDPRAGDVAAWSRADAESAQNHA